MPSEERDAEMLGREVWRSKIDENDWTDAEPMGSLRRDYEPGRWHAEPVAVAMVEALNESRIALEHVIASIPLSGHPSSRRKVKTAFAAHKALDAALGGGRNG